jgi:hypothetical protein
VLEIVEESGAQGASGSQVRYFHVKSADNYG